jgi:hypothetical protein
VPHEIGAAKDERSAEVQLKWLLTWLMEAMEHFARLEAEARERIASTEHGAPEDRASAAEASPYPASSREYGTGGRRVAGNNCFVVYRPSI